jgi:hypothetical protein
MSSLAASPIRWGNIDRITVYYRVIKAANQHWWGTGIIRNMFLHMCVEAQRYLKDDKKFNFSGQDLKYMECEELVETARKVADTCALREFKSNIRQTNDEYDLKMVLTRHLERKLCYHKNLLYGDQDSLLDLKKELKDIVAERYSQESPQAKTISSLFEERVKVVQYSKLKRLYFYNWNHKNKLKQQIVKRSLESNEPLSNEEKEIMLEDIKTKAIAYKQELSRVYKLETAFKKEVEQTLGHMVYRNFGPLEKIWPSDKRKEWLEKHEKVRSAITFFEKTAYEFGYSHAKNKRLEETNKWKKFAWGLLECLELFAKGFVRAPFELAYKFISLNYHLILGTMFFILYGRQPSAIAFGGKQLLTLGLSIMSAIKSPDSFSKNGIFLMSASLGIFIVVGLTNIYGLAIGGGLLLTGLIYAGIKSGRKAEDRKFLAALKGMCYQLNYIPEFGAMGLSLGTISGGLMVANTGIPTNPHTQGYEPIYITAGEVGASPICTISDYAAYVIEFDEAEIPVDDPPEDP